MKRVFFIFIGFIFINSCSKTNDINAFENDIANAKAKNKFAFDSLQIDNQTGALTYYHISLNPSIKIFFSKSVDTSSVSSNIQLEQNTTVIPVHFSYVDKNKEIIVSPNSALAYITKYTLNINANLSSGTKSLNESYEATAVTTIDSSNKFKIISDSSLLTLIEKQTFNYFWINGNPISGMARERLSGDATCATGGTGFGVMTIPVAVNRGFITRSAGAKRVLKIVNFLDQYASKYHGAFAHWINGNSGATIPFSAHDDGADLVETSYLMEGLLTARQYFNGSDSNEINLRATINKLYQNVEWDWFTDGGYNTLYWHWSPDYGWDTYMQINGWDEAMITYVLAASSPTHPIDFDVYRYGWAKNGGEINGNTYYGYTLPLGPAYGGPLFFEHYSFLGLNPNGLSDIYGNYQTQTTNHSLINYSYCVANPGHFNGYSDSCWGLTASDEQNGYNAHSPTNDDGVISPTAAISSLPYTPAQSMAAIKFFYYKLGDKIWNYNGFCDAFNLTNPWFDTDYLAIDQGPEIVMIENYRSGLLWSLFTSCPEVKKGLKKLEFTAPYL